MSFNPEKLNIKDLTIEEPESKEDFKEPLELRKYISEDRMQIIRREALSHYGRFTEYSAFLNVIGQLDEKEREISVEELQKYLKTIDQKGYYYIESQYELALLGEKPEAPKAGWEEVDKYHKYHEFRRDHTGTNFPQLVRMKIAGYDLKFSPAEYDSVREEIKYLLHKEKNYEKQERSNEKKARMEKVLEMIAGLKVAGEKYELSSQDLDKITQDADLYAVKAYVDLAVILSNDISVPKGGGLELHNYKEREEQKEDLIPEQRKF